MFTIMTNVSQDKRPEFLPGGEAAAQQGGGGILLELMSDCWATRPRDRPQFAEVLERLRRASGESGSGDAEAVEAKRSCVQGFDFE